VDVSGILFSRIVLCIVYKKGSHILMASVGNIAADTLPPVRGSGDVCILSLERGNDQNVESGNEVEINYSAR